MSSEGSLKSMMYYDGSWAWSAWLVMGLIMIAFWGLIIGLVLTIVRPYLRNHNDEAMRTLDERFARGEIDADDYRNRRELLRQ